MVFGGAVARYIASAEFSGEVASRRASRASCRGPSAPRLGDGSYDPCFGLGGFLSESIAPD